MVALVTQLLEPHARLRAAQTAADRAMLQQQSDATDVWIAKPTKRRENRERVSAPFALFVNFREFRVPKFLRADRKPATERRDRRAD